MPSFTVHDPAANSERVEATSIRDFAYASLATTPNAPSGNRGPGNADNRIAITEMAFSVGGMDNPSNVHFGVWMPSGNRANVYVSPRLDMPEVGRTWQINPVSYRIPHWEINGELPLSGGTSYYFGVHNPGVNGIAVRRTQNAVGFLGRDDSYGDTIGAPLGNSFDATKYENCTLIATVTYIYLPSKPATISAIGGKNRIQVNWTAPVDDGGTPVEQYVMYIKKSSDANWQPFDANVPFSGGPVLTYTFTDLDNSTSYDIRVAAWNEATYNTLATHGEYSDVVTVTTAPAGPLIWTGTAWTYTEAYVCTSAGTWTAAPLAEVYVCTSVSPSVVWTILP